MILTYEISETLEVRIYADGNETPFIYQPYHPDSTAFENYEDAEIWAQGFIFGLTESNEAPIG